MSDSEIIDWVRKHLEEELLVPRLADELVEAFCGSHKIKHGSESEHFRELIKDQCKRAAFVLRLWRTRKLKVKVEYEAESERLAQHQQVLDPVVPASGLDTPGNS